MSKGLALHSRTSLLCLLAFAALLISPVGARASITIEEAAKSLPDQVAGFRAEGAAQLPLVGFFEFHLPEDFGALSHAARAYRSDGGQVFYVNIIKTSTDSG